MLQSALTLKEQTANSGPLSTGLFQTHPPQPGPPVFGGLARTLFWTETASLLLPSVVAAISLGSLSPWRCLLTNYNVYMGAVGYRGAPLYNVVGHQIRHWRPKIAVGQYRLRRSYYGQ